MAFDRLEKGRVSVSLFSLGWELVHRVTPVLVLHIYTKCRGHWFGGYREILVSWQIFRDGIHGPWGINSTSYLLCCIPGPSFWVTLPGPCQGSLLPSFLLSHSLRPWWEMPRKPKRKKYKQKYPLEFPHSVELACGNEHPRLSHHGAFDAVKSRLQVQVKYLHSK